MPMQQIKWIERKFYFGYDIGYTPFFIELEKPVKLTTLGRFKLTRAGRMELTTLGRSKMTTPSAIFGMLT